MRSTQALDSKPVRSALGKPRASLLPARRGMRSVAGHRGSFAPLRSVSETVTQAPTRKLAVYEVDPGLVAYEGHLNYRYERYEQMKVSIEKAEGSLAEFAQGYNKLGFTRENGAIVYREWAPAAQAACLIGDFNNWEGSWMNKDQWGVWSVTLPDVNGGAAIPHRSRLKIRLQDPRGGWVDRLPAMVKYATVEPGVMAAKYDGIYWDPPAQEQYKWKHPRPSKPQAVRVYEAHVGMSGEEPRISTYAEFRDNVLPRIKKAGYNTIQLMAIQEHAYYASFGYHVTNPFAVSSRSGTPEDLKSLIDEAHGMGLYVLLDVVHSHISSNVDDGLAGFDMGQSEEMNYFCTGAKGYHQMWDSRCLNYAHWETLRYLLSNLRYWMDEFKFDGFRYFGMETNVDAMVYLMLANDMVHSLVPGAITIAEDVSGMPTLCRKVGEGGVGFDMRLAMGIPDRWVSLLKHSRDEHWSMADLVNTLRYSETTMCYSESHDQALVGDQTMAFRMMGASMYDNMSALKEQSDVMIRLVTMALGGEAYLNFMGNEFGHPDWIDFPRDGNDWSHHHSRRQWSLGDSEHLLYHSLGRFDRAMMQLDDKYKFLSDPHQWVTHTDEAEQVLVFERGPLVFVLNWSPTQNHEGYEVATPTHGKWRVVLDSDSRDFGGKGCVGHDVDHFTEPTKEIFHDRMQYMRVLAPSRTIVVYANADVELPAEPVKEQIKTPDTATPAKQATSKVLGEAD
eukprot:gene20992-27850_t